MESHRKKPGPSHSHLLLVFFTVLFPFSHGQETDAVGYGYVIDSVAVNLATKSLNADLILIKNSSVYGSDIQSLNLLARYVFIFHLKLSWKTPVLSWKLPYYSSGFDCAINAALRPKSVSESE